jgi:hypothetical protein
MGVLSVSGTYLYWGEWFAVEFFDFHLDWVNGIALGFGGWVG